MLVGFGGSLTIKYVSIDNPVLSNLNSDELHCYSFIISMKRHNGSCNTAEDPYGRICASNKMKDINLKVFSMIQGINEMKDACKTYLV